MTTSASPAPDRRAVAHRIRWRLQFALPWANALGAAIVLVYLMFVFPSPGDPAHDWVTNVTFLAVAGAYLLLAMLTGVRSGIRISRPLLEWREGDAPPGERERRDVLALPRRLAWLSAVRWAGAAVIFGAFTLVEFGGDFALALIVSITLGGIVTCTSIHLATARLMRPMVGVVFAGEPPARTRGLGVGAQIILTWGLTSVLPVVALILLPIARPDDEAGGLLAPMLFIAGVVGVFGFLGLALAVRGVTHPVRVLRRTMEEVQSGRTDVAVAVDDASEIGRLQAGFNAMLAGLRERERLHDLFGRQVGAEVAREVLERGVELGGESREVSALFVDVVGSTELASRESPERVVELLNRFFAVVVEVTDTHGGLVNKFEGDAALLIFGAPVAQPDHAARALAAARELRDRLAVAEREGLTAGIGVSSGTAVAGQIGAESRFEYTVIGDPVNEAARLCDLAKRRAERVLASGRTLELAGGEEAGRWQTDGSEVLRGRDEATELVVPVAS